MENSWAEIAEDFLSFTLKNIHRIFPDDPIYPPELSKQYNNFTVSLLGNGLLFFLPKHHQNNNLLILSAGVHGNETAPMELLQQWTIDLFSENISLNTALVIIIGNPTAAVNAERFMKENLNRLFNPQFLDTSFKAQNSEQLRAIEIMKHLINLKHNYKFKNVVHFDLHTAIRPSAHEKFLALPYVVGDNSHQLLQFWSDCGLTAALRSVAPAGTFSYFSQSQLNAISATVELGKVHPFGENNLEGLSAVDKGIRDFIDDGTWPKSSNQKMLKLFQVKTELIKTSENFKLNINDNFANFTEFKQGYLLAQDDSKNYQYKIDADADVLVFPNTNLPVGQRAGLVAECIN